MLYRFDEFELDTENFELHHLGVALHVEPQTFDFLLFLIQNSDRIVTRDDIIEHVWQGRIVSDTTISSCVKSARKVLGDDGENQRYIKTTRGRGFQFIAKVNPDMEPVTESINQPYNQVTSQISKPTVFYLLVCGLIFIIGLLLFNQFQAAKTDNKSTVKNIASSDAPFTIAVMPFTDLSAEGNQEYFGDGISEEVLNVLTSVEELSVTSRTTAFTLKGQKLSVPEIADRLNVKYIVEGSVRSSGNRIRITAQLIDTLTDTHLWSENYDRELNDIFAIQDDISQQIANALKVELIGGTVGRAAPTNNMESYALYLQGHQLFLNRGTSDISQNVSNLEQAIDFLEQAVRLDKSFAIAWADLATSYIVLPSYFTSEYPIDRVVLPATEASNRAISLDSNLSQAWAVKSLTHLSQFQFQDSETAILRATELNPDNAKGEIDKAIPYQDKAINEMGFEFGRYDRALIAIWRNDPANARDEMIRFFRSSDQGTGDNLEEKLDIYAKSYFDPSLRDQAITLIEKDMEEGTDVTFGLYMLQDAEKIVHDFENTGANKGFILSRIYFPLARPLFKQKIFRDYLINIGLLAYWKNNQFPDFCRPAGTDDFECDITQAE
ncbi:MAG: hypothetical protein HOJ34_07455 [Kordiimonadaceae bacterium]|nr:hypothetical protein [Kordiimonadaceae bacterium]MBT6329605.1 hypothetical protein [Kordiimonadaceae bacterium]